MNEREKISRYFSGSGNGELANRLLDLADQVRTRRPLAVSDFVSPYAGQIATTIHAHFPGLEVEENGGYHGAERIKIAFFRPEFAGKIDWNLSAVEARWDPRFRLLGHRDVLGALMGLGLEREVFGDVLMQSTCAQVVVDRTIVPYLLQNWQKIAMVNVTPREIPLTELVPKIEKVKEVRATVASLRLDAIGAAGYGMSRTKMVAAISAEKVQVNWQRAKGPAQIVAPGDVISVRGRGRLVVAEITGTSRKGRTGLRLERYQ